jgi:hypothetical protein
MTEIELPLTTCDITSITKLADPVMDRSDVIIGYVRGQGYPVIREKLHQG